MNINLLSTGTRRLILLSIHLYIRSLIIPSWSYCCNFVSEQAEAMTLFIIIYPYYGYIQLMSRARCIFVYVDSILGGESMIAWYAWHSGSTIVLFPFSLSKPEARCSRKKVAAPDLFYYYPLLLSQTETNN